MAKIKQTALLPYTTGQMFDLVNDLERYPEFLPWCTGTTVHHRNSEEVRASIHLMKGGIRHSFTTLNRLQQNSKIEVSLLEGPLRHLQGYWQFEALEHRGCQIHFSLEFEFFSKLISSVVTPLVEKTAAKFIDAFCQRAELLYGR